METNLPLSTGSKLGPYEILAPLGAGGMGEVYRARDPRLGREVAIKVLPAGRVADENRRRRFVQEARAASALNHPHIVTIYEIESAEGIDFIVMEYVSGRGLDTLIPHQGMTLANALRTSIPIADALAQAHARGIVHRDLKPANVMVSSEGVVKVLDFGLAKVVFQEEASDERDTENTDTVESPLTHLGKVCGTPSYMSPEQATAGQVDSRSDVFAFGAVLYEMVTGRRAFAGGSTAETLAAVVATQPKPPSEVVAGVPKELDRLIQRCLRKDPDRRFQHMLDVKVELNEIKEESDSAPAVTAAPARPHRLLWLVVGLGMSAAGLTAAAWLLRRTPGVPLPPPRLVPLTAMRGWERNPTFSPDGTQFAFSWGGEKSDNTDIYIEMVGSSDIRRLTTDPAEDVRPSWSPDGRQIAFIRSRDVPEDEDALGEIRVVSTLGGVDRKLSDLPAGGSSLSWSPDGRWLAAKRHFTRGERDSGAGGIYFIPAQGGEPRRITSPRWPGYDTEPAFSPDGRRLAYASCVSDVSCQVQVQDLGADGLPNGPPRRLPLKAVWLSGLAWLRDGKSLIYGDDRRGESLWRVAASGEGPPERIEIAGLKAGNPVTTTARDRLAFVRSLADVDVYRFEVGRAPQVALASTFNDYAPAFSPDGHLVAFGSGRSGEGSDIWLAEADGANPTQLTHGPGVAQGSPRFSPDGRQIAFDSQGEDGHWDIYLVDPQGGVPRRLTQDPGDENQPVWSANGRFVYFNSDRGGDHDVWRIPAAGGPEERLTHGGGDIAYESADGQTLLFKRGPFDSALLAQPLAGGTERQLLECVPQFGFTVGRSGVYHFGCQDDPSGRPLFLLDPVTGRDRLLAKLAHGSGALAVSPDGKAVLYTKQVGDGGNLMMIENFR